METSNNINGGSTQKVALIAPLDWGLGHATRCIPVVKSLQNNGWTVLIACNSVQRTIFEGAVSNVKFYQLSGYDIKYGSSSAGTVLRLMGQVPKILMAIKRENLWLQDFLSRESVELIISDNRYGFSHRGKYSVFVTHQLFIETPFPVWISKILQKINYNFIKRFSACWIPDFAGNYNLAGYLSHPAKLPSVPVKYVGLLTRFCYRKANENPNLIAIILSGPEPQRTILEKKLIEQCSLMQQSFVFIRGLPQHESKLAQEKRITFYNHLADEALQEIISRSAYIICRSGYSSMMDLLRMKKKCIVIPTPGQPEQQYLAGYLHEKNFVLKTDQQDVMLSNMIDAAKSFNFRLLDEPEVNLLETAILQLPH